MGGKRNALAVAEVRVREKLSMLWLLSYPEDVGGMFKRDDTCVTNCSFINRWVTVKYL
jgi:hypothetical protein